MSKHRGKIKLSSAEFFNCEHEPLCRASDSTAVLSLIPPMELHFLLGIVNLLYDLLDKLFVANEFTLRAKVWSGKIGVKQPKQHGG